VYPNSTYVETARLRVANLRQYLAKAEFHAGYFYQRTRRALRSAIGARGLSIAGLRGDGRGLFPPRAWWRRPGQALPTWARWGIPDEFHPGPQPHGSAGEGGYRCSPGSLRRHTPSGPPSGKALPVSGAASSITLESSKNFLRLDVFPATVRPNRGVQGVRRGMALQTRRTVWHRPGGPAVRSIRLLCARRRES
jgi:hypothetical protein